MSTNTTSRNSAYSGYSDVSSVSNTSTSPTSSTHKSAYKSQSTPTANNHHINNNDINSSNNNTPRQSPRISPPTSPPILQNTSASSSTEIDLNEPSPAALAAARLPLDGLTSDDIEASQAAVAQEMSNLQALRRMSMEIARSPDPDLPPQFASGKVQNILSSVSPRKDIGNNNNNNDQSKLLWVPAHMHPELAPGEWRNFLQDKGVDASALVDPDDDMPLINAPFQSSLGRKKSLLSRQVSRNDADSYHDASSHIDRQKSSGQQITVADLERLDSISSLGSSGSPQPSRQGSLSSQHTNDQINEQPRETVLDDDTPIVASNTGIKRSARTTYRKGGRGPSRQLKNKQKQDESSFENASPTLSFPVNQATQSNQEGTNSTISSPKSTFSETYAHDDRPQKPTNYSQTTNIENLESSTANLKVDERWQDNSLSYSSTRPEHRKAPSPQPVQRSFSMDSTGSNSSTDSSRLKRPGLSRQKGSETRENINEIVSSTAPSIVVQASPTPIVTVLEEDGLTPDLRKTPSPSYERSSFSDDSPSDTPTTKREGRKLRRRDSNPKMQRTSSEPVTVSSQPKKSSWNWLFSSESEKDGKIRKSRQKTPETKKEKVVEVKKSAEEATKARPSAKDGQENQKDNSKDSSLFLSIFGKNKKQNEGSRSSKSAPATSNNDQKSSPPPFYYSRFPIQVERAIYRLSHIKLSDPRRPLVQQVLLSNFMYGYLNLIKETSVSSQQNPSPAQNQIAPVQQGQYETEQSTSHEEMYKANNQSYGQTYKNENGIDSGNVYYDDQQKNPSDSSKRNQSRHPEQGEQKYEYNYNAWNKPDNYRNTNSTTELNQYGHRNYSVL